MLQRLANFCHRLAKAGLITATFALMLLASPLAMAANTPVGVWKTIDDETGEAKSLVQISESDGKLRGKIIKLFKDPDALCDKCEGDEKNMPILGMTVLWGMSQDDDAWAGGKIFDPKKGKTYRCKIWVEEDGNLKVRGYLGPFFRTQRWVRFE